MTTETIKLAKCNGDKVDAQLAELELDTNGSLKQRVSRLSKYYEEHSEDLDIAHCDVCGADSDANLSACPFCGDEGAVADGADGDDAESDEPETEEEAEEPEESEVVEAQMGTQQVVTSSSKKTATKVKATKVAAKPKAEAKPNGKAASHAKVAAPVVETTAIAIVDSTALDEQVQVIREAVLGGAISLHRLGQAATTIVTDNLWKQRADEQGTPKFRSFKQFCAEELGMTAVHIYRAMKVAEEFTEADLKLLSGRQVRLMLDVPKESRSEVLEAAKRGEAGSKLSDRANDLRGKAGKNALPEPKKAITVAVTQGHTKLKMFKRPTAAGVKVGDTENATPAKKLADQPWAVLDLSNKVRMMIRVTTNPKGEMVADVEFRRGEV